MWTFFDYQALAAGNPGGTHGARKATWRVCAEGTNGPSSLSSTPMACPIYGYVFRLGIANGVLMAGSVGLFDKGLRDGAIGAHTRHALYVGSGVRVCVADLCMRPSSVSLLGREIITSIIRSSTRRDCHSVESSRVCIIESVAAGSHCHVAFGLESDAG